MNEEVNKRYQIFSDAVDECVRVEKLELLYHLRTVLINSDSYDVMYQEIDSQIKNLEEDKNDK